MPKVRGEWEYLRELGENHQRYWQDYLTEIKEANASRLPIIAVIGWVFYEEAIEPTLFLGAGLIFLGIWLTLGTGASRTQGGPVTKP
ncbi:MAG: hypothetical protein HC778_00910 [Chamaesiphon sp. CSU_1_12]|nr:hypothetical protein [Chamaesiphon sp. CSU_1_12]